MEGEVKIICNVKHIHLRCALCGDLVWTQLVKGKTNQGLSCNECAGVHRSPVSLGEHWKDAQFLRDREV